MASPEFELIARYFTRPTQQAILGIGDDCALFRTTPGMTLAVSTDTLCAGTHFFSDADPTKLGHKALAVNLSDLAAMGATPRFATLALTLPSVNHAWLSAFSRGFFGCADAHGCELVGGDTTRGPLAMTITVFGELDAHTAMRRDAARDGDDIWISGTLGGAALALAHLQERIQLPVTVADRALERLHTPQPRVGLGLALRGIAHAAIDVSDGLLADVAHIATRSQLAATLNWSAIPLHPSLLAVGPEWRTRCALSGGDDYELCFTAPIAHRAQVEEAGHSAGVAITRVGRMSAGLAGVTVVDERGLAMPIEAAGYDHFSGEGE